MRRRSSIQLAGLYGDSSLSLRLSEATKFFRGTAPTTLTDLKVGENFLYKGHSVVMDMNGGGIVDARIS